jgi:hypothetical protein
MLCEQEAPDALRRNIIDYKAALMGRFVGFHSVEIDVPRYDRHISLGYPGGCRTQKRQRGGVHTIRLNTIATPLLRSLPRKTFFRPSAVGLSYFSISIGRKDTFSITPSYLTTAFLATS